MARNTQIAIEPYHASFEAEREEREVANGTGAKHIRYALHK